MLEDIYVVHHTHMDIGYTDLAEEVLDQHLLHLDAVVELCERTAGSDVPFRWTCESALLVQDYLACRPRGQRERLLHALREGWVELQALLTQPLTELASGEDLFDCVAFAVDLGRRESFAVESAVIDDIGGYAGRLPSVFSPCGVRYLVAGVGSFQVHVPWADLPHLFYLEDRGGGRTLVWNLGIDRSKRPQEMDRLDAVYGLGSTYLIRPYAQEFLRKESRGVELDTGDCSAPRSGAREQLAQLERRLERESYPYTELMLQYAGDNRGPDPDLTQLVSALNSAADLPRIHLTTPSHFFRALEAKYGDSIPVLCGVITDPWNLRANPTPSGLKTFRRAQRALHAAEARQALAVGADLSDSVKGLVEAAQRNVQLYIDHTCGLSEWGWQEQFDTSRGCRDAAFDRYRRSWATKRIYAESALAQSGRLDRQLKQQLASELRRDDASVIVWNDSSRAVSGAADLYLGRDARALAGLVDVAEGQPVRLQCVGRNRYVIEAPPVPAFGARVLRAVFGNAPASGEGGGLPSTGVLEGDFLRLRIDPDTGRVQSLVDKRNGREWADAAAEAGIGEFLYHRIHGVQERAVQSGMNSVQLKLVNGQTQRVCSGSAGDVFSSVVVDRHVERPAGRIVCRTEYRLYRHLPLLDLRVRLDKPETEHKESCSVALPFGGPAGVFRFDQNIGWVEPSTELLPGAMQDAFYCWSWVNVTEGDSGVTVSCPDVPIFQFGTFRTDWWSEQLPFAPERNHLHAWLVQNQLNTDCPIWQDVLDEFRFGLTFHDHGFCPSAVQDAAASASGLLHAQFNGSSPGGAAASPLLSALQVEPRSVRVVSARRIGAKTVRLRLEETSGEQTATRLTFAAPLEEAWIEPGAAADRQPLQVAGHHELELALSPHSLTTLVVRLG